MLPVSATASRSADGDHAACCGSSSGPPPVLDDPNTRSNVPSAWKSWMRWLSESATAIVPGGGGGPQDAERGLLNSPVALPNEPNV